MSCHFDPNQNSILALICISRGEFAWLVILPKFDDVVFVEGPEKRTLLKRLKASHCNRNFTRSLIRKSRFRLRS